MSSCLASERAHRTQVIEVGVASTEMCLVDPRAANMCHCMLLILVCMHKNLMYAKHITNESQAIPGRTMTPDCFMENGVGKWLVKDFLRCRGSIRGILYCDCD